MVPTDVSLLLLLVISFIDLVRLTDSRDDRLTNRLMAAEKGHVEY